MQNNFNELFYGPLIPDYAVTAVHNWLVDKKIFSDKDSIVDESVVVNLVKAYYNQELKSKKRYETKNRPDNYFIQKKERWYNDFYDFCERSDNFVEDLNDILKKININVLIDYANVIKKKHKYTKYHFRNPKFLLDIYENTINLERHKNSRKYEFAGEVYKKINTNLYWTVIDYETYKIDSFDSFLYNKEYQLRRKYKKGVDNPIVKNTGLEKIEISVKKFNNELIVQCEHDFDKDYIIDVTVDFLCSLYKKSVFDINFKHIQPNVYKIISKVCENTKSYAPIKLYVLNEDIVSRGISALTYRLHEHFYDSYSISIKNNNVFYKHPIRGIFTFLTYIHHGLNDDILKCLISDRDANPYVAEEIWNNLIDFSFLSYRYEFENTHENMRKFRNLFVNSYNLIEAFRDSPVYERYLKTIDTICDYFKMSISEDGNNYFTDISVFIKRLLVYESFEYELPTEGWQILGDYFKIFNKIDIPTARYSEFDVHINDYTVTDMLIEIIEYNYTKEYIHADMNDYKIL